MKHSYIYLSLRVFPIIRYLVVGILAINLVSWVTGFWTIWITIGILLAFLSVIILHLGQLRIINDGENTHLELRDLFRRVSLPSPLYVETKWTYSFNVGLKENEEAQMTSRANDIHVYLMLAGSGEESVTFHEFIGIDSRFPNESEYSERIHQQGLSIEVQRTDKILAFLQKYLSDGHLTTKLDN